jgi:hypothetical protein
MILAASRAGGACPPGTGDHRPTLDAETARRRPFLRSGLGVWNAGTAEAFFYCPILGGVGSGGERVSSCGSALAQQTQFAKSEDRSQKLQGFQRGTKEVQMASGSARWGAQRSGAIGSPPRWHRVGSIDQRWQWRKRAGSADPSARMCSTEIRGSCSRQ